jgi:hypothetical protein
MLKVMLWSLGVAVVFGVFAALTASFHIVGRVAATAVLTSVVAAILWRLAGKVESQMPVVSRIMDVACVVFFLFANCGIWSIGDEDKMWGTAFASLCAGGLAASGFWQTQFTKFKLTGYIIAACAGPALVCWLLSIWWSDSFSQKLFLIGVALVCWAAPAALSLAGWTPDDRRIWRWVGVAAAGFALIISIHGIVSDGTEVHAKILTALGSVSVVVVHANLVLLAPLQGLHRWLRVGIIGTVAFCAACVSWVVFIEASGEGLLIRLTVASAILSSGGTIAIAFLGKRNATRAGRVSLPTATSPFSSVTLQCPKCGSQQTLPVGPSHCKSCGLGFRIEVHSAQTLS